MPGAQRTVLIVDNGSLSTRAIVRAVAADGWLPSVVACTELEALDGTIGAVILTGTDVPAYEAIYEAEVELIRACRIPLLGICGGMQLIGRAYGRGLAVCEPVVGRCLVTCAPGVELFDGLERRVLLFSRHRYRLEAVPSELELIAWSDACPIEGVRHRERPTYGMQAHVELRTEGRRILESFLRLAEQT